MSKEKEATGLNILLRLTPEQEIRASIEMATELKLNIQKLMLEYPDNRGNLAQAEEFASGIITNLRGHLADMQAGKEDYAVHPADCRCEDCEAERSDEHYHRRRDVTEVR